MILPSKNVRLSSSLLNVGSTLLKQMNNSQTITMLWNDSKIKNDGVSFEKFTLSLDFLFTIGLIDYDKGIIRKIK